MTRSRLMLVIALVLTISTLTANAIVAQDYSWTLLDYYGTCSEDGFLVNAFSRWNLPDESYIHSVHTLNGAVVYDNTYPVIAPPTGEDWQYLFPAGGFPAALDYEYVIELTHYYSDGTPHYFRTYVIRCLPDTTLTVDFNDQSL